MRPNTYCKQCRKPNGMRPCIHCKLKSKLYLKREFEAIITEPDLVVFNDYLERWYGGYKASSAVS